MQKMWKGRTLYLRLYKLRIKKSKKGNGGEWTLYPTKTNEQNQKQGSTIRKEGTNQKINEETKTKGTSEITRQIEEETTPTIMKQIKESKRETKIKHNKKKPDGSRRTC